MAVRDLGPLLLVSLVLAFARPAPASVVFVNKNATGAAHDGNSWLTAFLTVQAGVNACASGDEVWVAASTPGAPAYVENITLKDGVALYGGFVGAETTRVQRDWRANETILDGNNNDVIVSSSLGTVIDGFTIRNDPNGVFFRFGVNVSGGTSTITNCNVVGHGYGIYVENSSATITNCNFSKNSYGYYQNTGTSVVSRCTFSMNYAGTCIEEGSTTFSDCVFYGNSAEGFSTRFGASTVRDCAMSGNVSGAYTYSAPMTLINCTLTGNTYGVDAVGGTTTVSNCIAAFNGTGIYRSAASVPLALTHNDVFANTVSNYASVSDPTGADGNVSVDPLFVNRSAGNFHLAAGSQCINAGDDSVVIGAETDLAGKPRIMGAHVDIGAYEYDPASYTLADVASALSIAAGITKSTDSRLNVDGVAGVTITDAVHLARKAAGLEANP